MASRTVNPLLDPFLGAAERVARERPEVDLEIARELLQEAATMLHNGLALDGLDEHDTRVAVAGLAADLVAVDPGAAVRTRAQAMADDPGEAHDPGAVSGAYLVAAAILQL